MPLLPQHGDDAAAAKSARRHGQHARDEHDAEPEHTGSRNPGSGNAEALSTAARVSRQECPRRPYHRESPMPHLVTRRTVTLGLVTTALLGRSSTPSAQGLPKLIVTKDPTCGCCGAWVDHMRAAGFAADVVETPEINRIKVRLGVPQDLASCHTAEVGRYVIEGRVPAAEVKRLLAEKPEVKGLAVPGMPMGSPGMEMDGMNDTYEVVLFGPAGRKPFARYEGGRTI
jgi:hypothetical protein